jgi:hypothetical protein
MNDNVFIDTILEAQEILAGHIARELLRPREQSQADAIAR